MHDSGSGTVAWKTVQILILYYQTLASVNGKSLHVSYVGAPPLTLPIQKLKGQIEADHERGVWWRQAPQKFWDFAFSEVYQCAHINSCWATWVPHWWLIQLLVLCCTLPLREGNSKLPVIVPKTSPLVWTCWALTFTYCLFSPNCTFVHIASFAGHYQTNMVLHEARFYGN